MNKNENGKENNILDSFIINCSNIMHSFYAETFGEEQIIEKSQKQVKS